MSIEAARSSKFQCSEQSLHRIATGSNSSTCNGIPHDEFRKATSLANKLVELRLRNLPPRSISIGVKVTCLQEGPQCEELSFARFMRVSVIGVHSDQLQRCRHLRKQTFKYRENAFRPILCYPGALTLGRLCDCTREGDAEVLCRITCHES